jgi:hypothetical protein
MMDITEEHRKRFPLHKDATVRSVLCVESQTTERLQSCVSYDSSDGRFDYTNPDFQALRNEVGCAGGWLRGTLGEVLYERGIFDLEDIEFFEDAA